MTDPGSLDQACCKACGTVMGVRRNVETPRGFAEAMGGYKRPTDVFNCPNTGEDWHNQIITLMGERDRTSSAKLTTLLQEEIDQVLASRTPTKKGGWY